MQEKPNTPFPEGRVFLDELEKFSDQASMSAGEFSHGSGEKLPASIEGLGNVGSLLYRSACCYWGCAGGDHQAEWLAGRVVNQMLSSYRLLRSGYYDESLVLTRGVSEIANLLWLFLHDSTAQSEWYSTSRAKRLRGFSPAKVRERIETLRIPVPIEKDRYQRLCEVGVHPVPNMPPGHYSGTGRPVLGVLLQPVGVYVSATELCFSIALVGTAMARLLPLPTLEKKRLAKESLDLIESLGAFNILNYEELLQKAWAPSSGVVDADET